jgi:urea carboxylase system permease
VVDNDSAYLQKYGYKQQLDRKLGSFSTFAAGFSYISILTGAFQLFYVAFGFAGPAFFWTWPVVVVGQLAVGLCFAELSAHHPLAGSVYAWSKQLAGKLVSFMAGWLMFIACTVTVAGVALAMQVVLPAISPVFQLVGDGTGTYDFAGNAVILGTILVIMTTIINVVGVRLISIINNIGVAVELIASVLLIVLLALHVKRGPGIVFDTAGHTSGGSSAIFGALLASSLLATYILWGFDTAGSVAEETIDPRRRSPRAIIQALLAAGITGGFIMLFAMMAVGDINAQELSVSGLPYVITSVLGDTVGKIFLAAAAISIFVCCLTVQTGTVRIAFALARDKALPKSEQLAKVSDRTRTPVLPTVIVGIVAVVILLVNIRQPQIFTVVTSVVVVLAYLAYLLVTVPMLLRRFNGSWPLPDTSGEKYFSMGRWGVPVNLVAIAMGLFAVINMVWPRAEIYNPVAPFHWYLQWGGVITVAVVILAGLGIFAARNRATVDAAVPAPVQAVSPEPVQ